MSGNTNISRLGFHRNNYLKIQFRVSQEIQQFSITSSTSLRRKNNLRLFWKSYGTKLYTL